MNIRKYVRSLWENVTTVNPETFHFIVEVELSRLYLNDEITTDQMIKARLINDSCKNLLKQEQINAKRFSL